MNSVLAARKLSVVEGGPLDRLQLRLGLMKVHRLLVVRRAKVFALTRCALTVKTDSSPTISIFSNLVRGVILIKEHRAARDNYARAIPS